MRSHAERRNEIAKRARDGRNDCFDGASLPPQHAASGLCGTVGSRALTRGRRGCVVKPPPAKDDVSLIVIFLHGGLSTIDTLDLKPAAPERVSRGVFCHRDQHAGTPVCGNICRGWHKPPSGSRCCGHSRIPTPITVPPTITCSRGYHPTAAFNADLKPNNQRPSHGSIIAKVKGSQRGVPPYVCLPQMHGSCGAAYLGAANARSWWMPIRIRPGFVCPTCCRHSISTRSDCLHAGK